MKSLVENALGDDWNKLPVALKAHYGRGELHETGHMDIEYPWQMQVYLNVLRLFGALLNRRGKKIPVTVDKYVIHQQQYWNRTFVFPDERIIRFQSMLVSAGGNQLIEFVNSFLGLQMAVYATDDTIRYVGIRYVIKIGKWLLPVPESLVLGHTSIEERAIDEYHFMMDFRLVHPLFGQLFRYSGVFKVDNGNLPVN
ncbi:DUF4166 domain-containing protein [Undibacterium jejuense]|uniref:DUF4166 domain-containing protein n=2 Tax=Undibacterium jejuense TaxID=1344949 RepID=A0A923KPF7_9BURK|nr:DUF4166 domain-containing protein [Undibacterium jejuense]